MTFEEWRKDRLTMYGYPQYSAEDAWDASRRAALEEAIEVITSYQVPVGNSAAGEMACEWTMDALAEVRSAIRDLAKEPT